MKIKKNNIYNTFRCNTNYNTNYKKESLNDILKGTKSILISNNGFHKYISNYTQLTKRPTFKRPKITDYPLLKTEYSFLCPIKKKINNNSEDNIIKNTKKSKQLFLFNVFNKDNSKFLEKYNKRFYQFLRLKTEPNNLRIIRKNNYEKSLKRYNSFFIDFFDKWNGYNNLNHYSLIKQRNAFSEINFSNINENNNKKINNNKYIFNFNIKERYFGLHYDENEIFNNNYDNFILDKINFTKNNKIENYDINLTSCFNDSKEKKINLKLESIKITFFPQNNNSNNENFFIYLPLSFVFLFFYKDIDFCQKILISLLHFEEDFKTIKINDEDLYSFLNSINTNENKEKEEEDIDYLANFKLLTNNSYEKKLKYKYNIIDKKELYEKEMRKTYNKYNNLFTNKLILRKSSEKNESSNQKFKIKTKIIHSNNNIKFNYNEDNKNNITIEDNEKILNKKNILYNEYFFIWETPKLSYKVKLEMPKIFFLYEDITFPIVTYCNKHLFLYLYKNNFINWDFYILYYIFTIKDFRIIISQFLSLSKNYSLIKNSKMNLKQINNLVDLSMNDKNHKLYNLVEDNHNKSKNICLINKNIYNQINENNESLSFFYSNLNLNNYIIHFSSYHIQIEYKKLNPYIKWKFFLNFKQMQYLNEISKHEELITFLPKIMKTDFEYGTLNLNFNVFDDNFNANILVSEEKYLNKTKIDDEIIIEIDKPYVEIIQLFEDDKKLLKKELNNIFLRYLNKVKMDQWPKKIVETLINDLILNNEESGQFNLFKYNFFKINSHQDNSKNNYKLKRSLKQKMTYIGKNNIKQYESILKSLKKNKLKEG